MSRICAWCLLLILMSTALCAAERVTSASIQATATVVPPVGFSVSSDSTALVIRFSSRELPLRSEAFSVHIGQDRSRTFVSQAVLVQVSEDRLGQTVTLIPIAD